MSKVYKCHLLASIKKALCPSLSSTLSSAEYVGQVIAVGDLCSQAVVGFANRDIRSSCLPEAPHMAFTNRPDTDNENLSS